jgi:hypothetical protein
MYILYIFLVVYFYYVIKFAIQKDKNKIIDNLNKFDDDSKNS